MKKKDKYTHVDAIYDTYGKTLEWSRAEGEIVPISCFLQPSAEELCLRKNYGNKGFEEWHRRSIERLKKITDEQK